MISVRRLFTSWMLLLCFTIDLHAWEDQITTEYVLSANESLNTARELAIEKIKLLALESSGSYIEGNYHLKDGILKEEISSIKAAIVSLSLLKEDLSITTSGNVQLHLTALVQINEDILRRRIKQLSENEKLHRMISSLAAENGRLRGEIKKAIKNKDSSYDTYIKKTAFEKAEGLLRRLQDSNERLVAMLDSNDIDSLQSANERAYLAATQDIQNNILEPILKTPLSTKLVSLEKNADNSLTAYISVSWSLNNKLIEKTLRKYLTLPPPKTRNDKSHPRYILGAHYKDNKTGAGPSILSERIFRYLEDHPIYARVSVASQSFEMPVMYLASAFFNNTLEKQCSQPGTKYQRSGKSLCFYSLLPNISKVLPGTLHIPVKVRLSPEESQEIKIIALMVHKP